MCHEAKTDIGSELGWQEGAMRVRLTDQPAKNLKGNEKGAAEVHMLSTHTLRPGKLNAVFGPKVH